MNLRSAASLFLVAMVFSAGCSTGSSPSEQHSVQVAPRIDTVSTEPTPPVAPRIRFTIRGTNFEPAAARVFFTGPGCPEGCEVPRDAVDKRSPAELSGVADLAIGSYTITVRNGSGAPSNGATIALVGR